MTENTESYMKKIQDRLRNVIDNKNRMEHRSSEIHDDLFVVRQAVNKWANRSMDHEHPLEYGRSFLPDRPYIPIDSDTGLITLEKVRGEDLFVSIDEDTIPHSVDDPRFFPYVWCDCDVAIVPKHWLELDDDSYIIVLIPTYAIIPKSDSDLTGDQHDDIGTFGNSGYDITVIGRRKNKICKFISNNEEFYRKNRYKLLNGKQILDPLYLPPVLYNQVARIELTDIDDFPQLEEEMIVWNGQKLRHYDTDPSFVYSRNYAIKQREMVQRGSIAYLVRKGKPSVQKKGLPAEEKQVDFSPDFVPSPVPNK